MTEEERYGLSEKLFQAEEMLKLLRGALDTERERIGRLEAENAHLRISLGLAQSGQRKAVTEVTR